MKNITTKYVGPTNTRGSRVTASDNDGNRLTLPWRSEWDSSQNHAEACKGLCEKMGWVGTLQGGTTCQNGKIVGMAWVWLDKKTQIHIKPSKQTA